MKARVTGLLRNAESGDVALFRSAAGYSASRRRRLGRTAWRRSGSKDTSRVRITLPDGGR